MPLHFTNPDIQAKLEQRASQTGRLAEELVEDLMAGFFDELGKVRETLGTRYDDVKNGQVKLMPVIEVQASFQAKHAAALREHSVSA